jgi:hypothetical protein
MSGDHNMYQKDKSYLDFECPRCGHCCQAKGEEHMIREAMKQPEALRLADALDDEFVQGRISNHNGRKAAVELRRLALKQWVGLTDEEMRECAQAMNAEPLAKGWTELIKLARAIEAKLKEKNHG